MGQIRQRHRTARHQTFRTTKQLTKEEPSHLSPLFKALASRGQLVRLSPVSISKRCVLPGSILKPISLLSAESTCTPCKLTVKLSGMPVSTPCKSVLAPKGSAILSFTRSGPSSSTIKCSGRTPHLTVPSAPPARATGRTPKQTCPLLTCASTIFIDGLPMNWAANKVRGVS